MVVLVVSLAMLVASCSISCAFLNMEGNLSCCSGLFAGATDLML